MNLELRAMWIIAVIMYAIGGGIAVAYISKVGVKKVIKFVIISAFIGFVMGEGINQLFIHFKPDDPLVNATSAVFGGIGFWGALILLKSYHDDKNVMKQ